MAKGPSEIPPSPQEAPPTGTWVWPLCIISCRYLSREKYSLAMLLKLYCCMK